MDDGARDPDDDDDERSALAGGRRGPGVALEHARAEAENLERALRRVMSGGALIVGAVEVGRWSVVRADLCTPYALDLRVRLLTIDPAGWKGPEPRGVEFERWRAGLASLAPIGFERLPGVSYTVAYRRARLAAVALVEVLARLPGWWVVDADCWADGTGVVRLTLTPEDASRLAEVVV